MSGRSDTDPTATAVAEARSRSSPSASAEGADGRLSTAINDLERALAVLGLNPHGRVDRLVAAGSPAPTPPDRIMLAARILLSLAFPQHELGHDAAASRALDDAELAAPQPSRTTSSPS